MILFRRIYKLTFFNESGNQLAQFVQDLDVDGLRVKFHIRQQIGMINNIAEFHIFNMSPTTRFALVNATNIAFEAGYNNNLKMLHRGKIINIFDNRIQPDFIYSIYTLDSEGNITPLNQTLSNTMTDREMIKQIASLVPGLIVQDGNLQGLTDKPVQNTITIPHLTYIQAFQKLALQLNLNITITNHVLYTSSKKPSTGIPVGVSQTLLNYNNGMIGSPIIDAANSGITVKSFLNGNLIPDSYVTVETLSPQIQLGDVNFYHFNQEAATRGSWQIMTTDHVGDSRGKDWYSLVSGFGAALLSPENQQQ